MASLHSKQSGAALLAVLVVSVVLAIMLSVASQLMEQRLKLATQSKINAQNRARVFEKVSELQYILVTQELTVAGVSEGPGERRIDNNGVPVSAFIPIGDEIRIDGHLYKEEDGLVFSVQNEMGLIPINSSSSFWLRRWLAKQGLSAVTQSGYIDKLADYADGDTWQRPGGAEQFAYKNHQFTDIPNYLLQQCTEVQQVLGYGELIKTTPSLLSQCSLRRTGSININAIPLSLWNILWPGSTEKVKERRENNRWFVRQDDARAVEPEFLNIPEEWYSTLVATGFVVKVELNGQIQKLSVTRGNGLAMPLISIELHEPE